MHRALPLLWTSREHQPPQRVEVSPVAFQDLAWVRITGQLRPWAHGPCADSVEMVKAGQMPDQEKRPRAAGSTPIRTMALEGAAALAACGVVEAGGACGSPCGSPWNPLGVKGRPGPVP
jgi:hypothetical protein